MPIDIEDLKDFAKKKGAPEANDLNHWDISFWSERLRESKFDINEVRSLFVSIKYDHMLQYSMILIHLQLMLVLFKVILHACKYCCYHLSGNKFINKIKKVQIEMKQNFLKGKGDHRKASLLS